MRKQTKLAVGLSAAALLVLGASMTSLASGWVQEGDEWYYVLASGDYATDSWKSYNGSYFYLGDDGAMLTDQLIDDGSNYYYVDANGAMVKNTWVMIAADEDEEQDVEYRWYYFGSTGKAYKDSVNKTINGKKYGFDADGKMLFGFVDSESRTILNDQDDAVLACDMYFGTNDDGARYSGWLRYEDGFSTTDDYDDDDYVWFNFKSNGKKRVDAAKAKISGHFYAFNSDGVMETGFDLYDSTSSSYRYFSENLEDGSMQKSSWIYTQWDQDDEDSEHWYRTNSSGDLIMDATKKINSKWYAFRPETGRMQHGLVLLDSNKVSTAKAVVSWEGDPESNISSDDIYALNLGDGLGLYYFSDSESDGSMKTGASVKISLSDDDFTFGFTKTSGAAYQGIESHKIYINGILQKADSDEKYVVVEYKDKDYVINTSGKIQGTGVYKNGDDLYYVVESGSESAGYTIKQSDAESSSKAKTDDSATVAEPSIVWDGGESDSLGNP